MPAPRQINTVGIVLRRVNYGEADRILTLLTPDQGKLSAIAKGVRKSKSKLAGGVELFSISEISFIKGKNDIDTLTSTRLQRHFGNIVKELARSDQGYNFIKIIDKATEQNPEAAYFNLLAEAFAGLEDKTVGPELTKLWFNLHLLKTAGHAPNLNTDTDGKKLQTGKTYDFDLEQMSFSFSAGRAGGFSAHHIKFLRLAVSAERPHLLQRVEDGEKIAPAAARLVQSMLEQYIRL
jgi:DNA repair protein RecO (recombination protein O)